MTTTPASSTAGTTPAAAARATHDQATELEQRRAARVALRLRHTEHLTRLMEERADLRGVHALADFVDESVRWTA
jgi:hypothetical protein